MIPERARAVVVGGGVIGCSILYHLAKQGWTDTVLLEQYQLTHGSTWHSAGLVGQLRSSVSLTRMMQYSVGLYAELRELTGNDPGWHQLGGLRLASSQPRLEEIRRQAAWAKTFGLPMEIVSAQEAQERFPPMSTEGVLAAAFIPDDGYLDPSQLTFALADAARRLGARTETRVRVTGIATRGGRVAGVETDQGAIECEVVVNAAGMYAPELARTVGVDLPIIPYGHQYLITEPFEPPLEPLPTLRDPDNLVYFRTEVGGLVMGGYERNPAPWALDGIPDGFEAKLLPQEWDRMEELFANAIARVPALENAQIKMFFNGPEAFTPDADFLLGETDVPGFWVAAGGCAHGLAGAGGIGKVMGEWIVDGLPEWDVWPLDLRRFGRHYRSQAYTLARSYEALSQYYDIKYPGEEKRAGRPLRVSPVYRRHAELGASFGEKGGWERVNWYESNAPGGDEALRPRGWAGENWSPAIEVEARAARSSCALFDQSSFSKLEVLGPGALAFLERLCANRIDRPVGTVVYTQLLNARGGIEADLSVLRRADDRFFLVTGTAFGNHDRAWIEKHAPRDGTVHVNDVTSAYACLCLWGPDARDVLQPLTKTPLDFPYMQARELAVGSVPVLASRVTYVGELGWELYCGTEFALGLWDALTASGRVTPGGYRAIDSLRLEKGYRAWASDLDSETTPDEAGLSFAVKRDKGDFAGRDALDRTVSRKLVCLVLDDPRAIALGSEPVRADDEIVGRVTSGGYGYAVASSIALAYVPLAYAGAGTRLAVDIFGEWVGAEVRAEPLYDPSGARVRA
ncbi:MAG TPA: FAD-dependent oxidoreductase [Gaiellaceae bacterium]|nr:FAD-dependent oxidoreductase [Gaiellaceae bacterium]